MWSLEKAHLGFGFELCENFRSLYAGMAELADALASGCVTTVQLARRK